MAVQPLERAARKRIGSFYLSGLLRQYPKIHHEPVGIQDIHGALSEIPQGLVDLFSLSALRFEQHEVDFHTLPYLYTGHSTTSFSDEIEDALFTLEVTRRVDLTNFPPQYETRVPMFARVAGVDQATNRIVAATYDCETGELITAAVSIGDDESNPDDEMYNGSRVNQYWQVGTVHVENHLLTDIDNPYETPGIITDAMVKQTATDRSQAHTQLLIVGNEEFYSDPMGDKARVGITSGIVKLTKDADEVIINFRSYSLVEQSTWEIRLPRTLGESTRV